MLERLEVQSLGIIDRVSLELADGFVALTGETGAGKSLLVESLKLLAGDRAQSEMIRSGDDRLRVEAVFVIAGEGRLAAVLDELGIEPEATLVVRREFTSAGRTRCWVNDVPVTVGALQRLAPDLLAIHGQHEQYGLADPDEQRRLIDAFGGHDDLAAKVAEAYRSWGEAAGEAERLAAARERRRDRLDAIAFQLGEIDEVGPRPGEDGDLRLRRQVLRHAVRLGELSGSTLGRLADSEPAVLDELARAERELAEMVDLGLELASTRDRLGEARLLVEEVVREIQDASEGLSDDPGELEAVETRLYRLEQLMLKYGEPLEEVLGHRERLLAEQAELEQVEERVESARREASERLTAFDRVARQLQEARREAGEELAEAVRAVLQRLEMAGTRLEFEWSARHEAGSPLERDGRPVFFDAAGVESCELQLAPNPGEELRPMARIASGGELSRIHLALRTALRRRHPSRGLTLLFDEVDSGLGGTTAAALAELLADLARADQVLVVTHLPQVAARAGGHVRVEKILLDGRAVTRLVALSGSDREQEVARMLSGGELTDSARAHARVLLEGR